ncbi:copper homeostasis protein CutC [Pararhizobium sp.]|uniref:copper homeostasis protein CutC n=1 Tax=Pararhizobium sp. TaxID=1977563 RepID=UPI003BA9B56E
MSHILLEVCVEDASGLRAAIDGGADRIELCSALSVGGLTPSPGLMVLAGKADLPVYAMIRPRPGDFVFDASDIAVMRVEIDAARAAGLAGVVLGASRLDGALDKEALKELADHAQGLGLTLHRAFDLVPDFADAVETAVDLGFERILTSGGAKRAPDGIDHLAAIIADTRDRISIMPGSGVTLETVGELLSRLSVTEIHSSCSLEKPARDARLVSLGFVSPSARQTDVQMVRALKARLVAAP